MKISVIIPNFEDMRIQRAVASVRRQSVSDYEILIIDGGSTKPELLAYYDRSGVDRVVRERDRGIFDALNKGLKLATGDVIYLMGSDDEISDGETFADVLKAFAAEPGLDGVCIGCEFVNAEGAVIRTWYSRSISSRKIRHGLLPPHFSLFLRRQLYDLVGPFRFEEYGNVGCDQFWLFDLAIRKRDLRIATLPNHHLRMEYGGASTGSASVVWRQFKAVHRYARENARHLSAWFLVSPVRTLSKVFQVKVFRR